MVSDCFAGLQCLLRPGELTENAMINAWREIVKQCCENATAGTDGYRTGMVYVGSEYNRVHTPPRPCSIPGMTESLFSYEHEYMLVTAAVYGFYIVYVHPFADGNGRISRAVMYKIIVIPGLPLSKVINLDRKGYYQCIQQSEQDVDMYELDITPFYTFIVESVDKACDIYKIYTNPLNGMHLSSSSKMDATGKGYVSCSEVSDILGVDIDEAERIIEDLCKYGLPGVLGRSRTI